MVKKFFLYLFRMFGKFLSSKPKSDFPTLDRIRELVEPLSPFITLEGLEQRTDICPVLLWIEHFNLPNSL